METAATRGAMTLVWRFIGTVNRRSRELVPGLNVKRFVVLSYLEERGSMAQHTLCDLVCIDPNNLVLLLNELESVGFIERRRDPGDRRRHIVAITPAGREAFERADRAFEKVEEEVLGELSPEERASLRELLTRLLPEQKLLPKA